MLVALGAAGCGPQRMRFKHPAFMTEADCVACTQIALEHENADTRREAVVHIGQCRHLKHDTVTRALASVARQDASHAVRHAAVHALAGAATPAVAEPLMDVVSAPDEAPTAQDLTSAEVRYAAMQGLDTMLVRGELPEELTARCREAFLRLIENNPSRDVRMAAATLLRHFPERQVAEALIEALGQRDFGVVYESDRSLMHLTGERHHHDPAAWRGWLVSEVDPFANLGRIDAEVYPPEKGFWQQSRESTRRMLAGFGPK